MSAITDITARRDKLFAVAVQCVDSDETVDGSALGRMTDAVTKILPDNCPYDVVFKSLSPLLGSPINLTTLKDVVWAIAANIKMVKAGRAPYPVRITTDPNTVVVQVLAARRAPVPRKAVTDDSFQILFRGRIIKGFGCPLVFDWRWSSKFVSFRASRPDGFGFQRMKFGKPSSGRPYRHFSTLVGMRFTTGLSVSADGKKVLDNVVCGLSLQTHNKALMEMRYRATFDCPHQFTHPCHHCPKGQTSCPAACHPVDTVTKVCAGCGKEEEHDPYWHTGVCAKCSSDGRRSLL